MDACDSCKFGKQVRELEFHCHNAVFARISRNSKVIYEETYKVLKNVGCASHRFK